MTRQPERLREAAGLMLRLGWMTTQQIIDAVAIGQVTPGPLFTNATFISPPLRACLACFTERGKARRLPARRAGVRLPVLLPP